MFTRERDHSGHLSRVEVLFLNLDADLLACLCLRLQSHLKPIAHSSLLMNSVFPSVNKRVHVNKILLIGYSHYFCIFQ